VYAHATQWLKILTLLNVIYLIKKGKGMEIREGIEMGKRVEKRKMKDKER
jgi:hypothetical protein